MRWGFYLGNVDFLKEHQLAVCSADSRNWTQTAAATECRNPLLTKHRHKQDREAFVKLHHPPILTPARALLQNTQGSPLALQRSGAVPLLPPTPAAGTRLLSQEKGQGSCLKRSIIQLRLAQISIPLKTKSLPCTSQHNRQTTALMVHEKRKTENISVITEQLFTI